MSITHAKVSAVADGADTSLVRPSDWNASHSGTAPFGTQVITVGAGGQFTGSNPIQAAYASITDSSVTKPYTILILPGTYTFGPLSGDELIMGAGGKDYINLVGLDPTNTIIDRPSSPGVGSPVIDAQAMHVAISNLTVTSVASRLIHHDVAAGSVFTVDNCNFPVGGGGNGISTGITGAGSIYKITNCYIGQAGISVHNDAGTAAQFGTVIVSGCTADYYGGAWLGFDMTVGSSSIRAYLSGNVAQYFDVDASHAVSIMLTEGAAPRVLIYTDAIVGTIFTNSNNVTKFWNRIIYPQAYPVTSSSAWAEGDVLTVTPSLGANYAGTAARTTTANSSFPVVVIDQEDNGGNSGWAPRIGTGPYAEVTCETAGAVAVGDILVTGTVSGQAKVNNAQTDPLKILGYAMTTKAGSTAGRVVVKLSPLAQSW